MAKNRSKPVIGVFVFLGLVFAHLALTAAFPARSDAITYVFYLGLALTAFTACVAQAVTCPPALQRNW